MSDNNDNEAHDTISIPDDFNSCDGQIIKDYWEGIKNNDPFGTGFLLCMSMLKGKEKCIGIGKVIGRNTHIKSLDIYKDGDTEIMSRSSEAIEILSPLFENNGIKSLTFGNCTGAHIQQLSSALLG